MGSRLWAFAVAALGVGLVAYGLSGWPANSAMPGRSMPSSAVRSPAARVPGRMALLGTCLVLPPVSIMGVATQTPGFGTGPAGVAAFSHAQAPLCELARRYVGTPLAALLDLGATLSVLGAGLGGVTVAARMMFAFGRDGLASHRLGGVSPATGVPRRALTAEMVCSIGSDAQSSPGSVSRHTDRM